MQPLPCHCDDLLLGVEVTIKTSNGPVWSRGGKVFPPLCRGVSVGFTCRIEDDFHCAGFMGYS